MKRAGFWKKIGMASAFWATVVALVFASLFGRGVVPKVHAHNGCTVATLDGPYGFSETGSIAGAGPLAVAGLTVFNGAGNMNANVTLNINGTAFPATATATYTVNSDCTETISLSTGETLSGVIVDGGREVVFINATKGFLGASGVLKKINDSD